MIEETTLVILKPDAVQRGLMGRIITRFEEKGLQIIGAKMIQIDKALADKHYAEHVGKSFYPTLLSFITACPVMVMAVRGKLAISVTRKLLGATKGFEADAGTIRGDFSNSKSFNLVHGSDSAESAERELKLYFKDEELHSYDRAIEPWLITRLD